MHPHRSWFPSYQTIDGGIVPMGNNILCKFDGVGSVEIKMLDSIIRTLIEVRHVPQLEKNLISLVALDSIYYNFTSQDEALKVSKRVLWRL